MKKHLLKTLLVGVMTLAATGAWAQTTYFSQDYEGDGVTADWTTGTSGRFTPVILEESGNHYLSVDQDTRNNNGTTLFCTSLQGTVDAETDFTMQFDLKLGSSNNQTPTSFEIYDAANSSVMLSLTATGTYAKTWKINGSSTTVELEGSGTVQAITAHTWYTVKFTRSGSLTYLTVTKKADNTVAFERALVDTKSKNGGLGKMQFVTRRYNANFAIDNIVVREIQDGDVPVAIPTTYTIKFEDESGNTIKNDVVVNSVVGIEVTASADNTASFYANDKKYIYKSGNDAITTVEDEDSNVITLVFREAESWSYTLNAVNGETILQTLKEGTAFEQDKLTLGYPLYINVDGTLWTKSATNKEFRTTITLEADNQVSNLAYTATEITDVIFLKEGEDIEGVTKFITGNSEIRSSNAGSGYSSTDVDVTTLAVGKYKMTVVACVATGTSNFSFKLGNREVCALNSGANNWASGESTFVVAKESTLTFSGGNANQGIDYIYIQSLGTPTNDELAEAAAADEAADQAAAIADAKAKLQTAISYATAIGATDLEDAIAAATTALNAEDATVESLTAAQAALVAAVKTYAQGELAKVKQMVGEDISEELQAAITAATTAMTNDYATAEDVANALAALQTAAFNYAKTTLTAAIAAAKAIDTEGKEGAETLATAIAAAEAALAAEDATLQSLYTAGVALKQAMDAFEKANTPAEIIVNAAFDPKADPIGWNEFVSGGYRDIGMYAIGGEQMVRFAAPTADDTHLTTEFAAGFEARWNSNYAAYMQTTSELPAGAYALTFDVENVNSDTSKGTYTNMFYVTTDGETYHVDESTEWMQGGSAWTTHTIKFILTEPSPITISLGYGLDRNLSADVTPALYVSHLAMGTFDPLADAKADLQAEIDAAQAMFTTYAHYTEGNDVFQEAIRTAETALTTATTEEELTSAIEALKEAEVAFHLANMFSYQKYVILNVASNKYWGTGNNWDTQASLVPHPVYNMLVPQTNGTYFLETQVTNGGTKFYFNGDYMDNDSPVALTITKVSDGQYTIANGTNYYGYDGSSTELGKNLAADSENVLWRIIPFDEAKDELLAATIDNPMDATILVEDYNFNRNNRYKNNWEGNWEQDNHNGNNVGQWYMTTGEMFQNLSDVPNGVYKLDAQAAVTYHDARVIKEYDGENAPVVYANEETSEFIEMEGDDKLQSQTLLGNRFNQGAYTVEPIFVEVTDNTLKIGAKSDRDDIWAVWDNFVLTYYGADATINDVKNKAVKADWTLALQEARDAFESDEYANVTGSEKATLEAEIAKDEPTTAEGYIEATIALKNVTSAFTAAKSAYDLYAEYKDVELPYADAAKKPAITEGATAATLITALRAYFESNAMAEGVEGATDVTTTYLMNYTDPTSNNDWTWTGNKNNPANNEPWTDADGTNTHSYFDGGNWGANSWTTTMEQTITLPAGVYLLTAKGRAAVNTTLTMTVGEASVTLPHVGNTGNVFDRGWGDGSVQFETTGEEITINVTATSSTIHEWFSVSDFRLVQLEEYKPVLGDLNGDGEVTVSDAVALVNIIVNDEVENLTPAMKKLADVTGDEEINIADVAAIVNIILEVEDEEVSTARMSEATADHLMLNGNSLELVNSREYTAFQMDVTLTDGATLSDVTLAARAQGLTLAYSQIGANTYRIVGYSLNRTAISQNSGTLLTLGTNGQVAAIDNVCFADANAHAYHMATGTVTGINALGIDTADADVYTVSGTKGDKLRKGINIVRQADGRVQKVLVK